MLKLVQWSRGRQAILVHELCAFYFYSGVCAPFSRDCGGYYARVLAYIR